MADSPKFALEEPRVREVLDDRWRRAARQAPRVLGEMLGNLSDRVLRRPPTLEREVRRIRDLYVPVSPKQGKFLYLLARARRAQRIVEFGTSFGLSTIHLAAALRDNGGGQVVGSELEPRKVAAARRNLEAAGLSDWAEIREGNALETLSDPGGVVDLVFLDGFAPLYLPVLEVIMPHLSPGAVVVADNLFTFRRQLKEAASGFRVGGFEHLGVEIKSAEMEVDGVAEPLAIAEPAGFSA